jgi:hypothetical protein
VAFNRSTQTGVIVLVNDGEADVTERGLEAMSAL